MSSGCIKIKNWLVAIAYLAIVETARPDLLVTNAAGVRAGITGIVYNKPGDTNTIGVDFVVIDPADPAGTNGNGTNVTTFTIQTNSSLKTMWADYSATLVVTGTSLRNEISDLRNNKTGQFYRMRLINFR